LCAGSRLGQSQAADTKVGIRGGYYTDIGDPFLGAEVLLPVAHRI